MNNLLNKVASFGWFWLVLVGFGWFWLVLVSFCWFLLVLAGFGQFWLVFAFYHVPYAIYASLLHFLTLHQKNVY